MSRPTFRSIVTADPGRLRQVLLNLIGNAIKFTDSGGVLVEVANAGTEAAPAIRFSVTDTGPGIPSGDLERIFEDFEQADGTSTRQHGGAGLGLAISRRIVTSMRGTIGVSSELGVGSTFHFEVPASDARQVAESGAATLAGRRVVILSKNIVEAQAIARTITSHGGSAEIVVTVAQAALHAAGADTLLVDATLEVGRGAGC